MPIPAVGPAPGLVDLHLHTHVSDGDLSLRELVDVVAAFGVGVAAITDHDDFSAARDTELVRHLAALGPRAPRMVPGVEISGWLETPRVPGGDQDLHIVGIGCDPYHPEMRKALIRQRLGTYARVRACVARLRAAGFDITMGQVGMAAGMRATSGWSIALLLAQRGFATDAETRREGMSVRCIARQRAGLAEPLGVV